MIIKIIAFGQIAEVTGKEFTLDVRDTDSLQITLTEKFPALANKKYALAVNKKLITVNIALSENDTVALMPPYSGG